MMDWITKRLRPAPDVVDQLMKLAEGDIDLLQDAIRAAAGSNESADLKEVVDYIVKQRTDRHVAA